MLLDIFHVNLPQRIIKVKFASLLSKIFLLTTPNTQLQKIRLFRW